MSVCVCVSVCESVCSPALSGLFFFFSSIVKFCLVHPGLWSVCPCEGSLLRVLRVPLGSARFSRGSAAVDGSLSVRLSAEPARCGPDTAPGLHPVVAPHPPRALRPRLLRLRPPPCGGYSSDETAFGGHHRLHPNPPQQHPHHAQQQHQPAWHLPQMPPPSAGSLHVTLPKLQP